MGLVRLILFVGVAVLAWLVAVKLNTVPPMVEIDPDPWWGPGDRREQNTNIRPFKIEIPQKDVDDFKARLSLTPRVVPALENSNFTYGVNSAAFSSILKYWKDSYDWRAREKKLNTYPHFKTRIEGLDIHFMRASPPKNSGKKVLPLLIVHGWPGSFVEFFGIIPYLTQPQANSDVVFDVICPSIPGYGFSEASAKTGMNTLTTAQIFVKLMERLGFKQFYAQGGDWGAAITTDIATAFPEKLYGLHLNMAMVNTPGVNMKTFLGAFLPSGMVMDSALEKYWYPLSTFYGTIIREMGYAHLHATKPDTVGVALNSSPQGLAAYILEKFSSWTVMENTHKLDGGLLDRDFPISLDSMLDNICVYWFTGSITSSMRYYAENMGPSSPAWTLDLIPTSVPTGYAACVNDLLIFPENLAVHKYTNLVTYTNPDGGHFAAMEIPAELAKDIHNFVNTVERNRASQG